MDKNGRVAVERLHRVYVKRKYGEGDASRPFPMLL